MYAVALAAVLLDHQLGGPADDHNSTTEATNTITGFHAQLSASASDAAGMQPLVTVPAVHLIGQLTPMLIVLARISLGLIAASG